MSAWWCSTRGRRRSTSRRCRWSCRGLTRISHLHCEGMMDIKYSMILYWSDEDQMFIAEVPELPGCAADGSTYQEAVANAEVVIREWTETARELGRLIPAQHGRLLDGGPLV